MTIPYTYFIFADIIMAVTGKPHTKGCQDPKFQVLLCGNVCTSDDDLEALRQRMDDKTYEQAFIAQLRH